MASFLVYRLRPRGPFHFGLHGVAVEESAESCGSDTLYAALLDEAMRCGQRFFAPPPGHDDRQPLEPPLLLSSCFPFIGNVLLLPRPRLRLPLTETEGIGKLLKHLTYVSPTIFRLILEGKPGSLDLYLSAEGGLAMGGRIWVARSDGPLPPEPFWRVEETPHVTVDRIRAASAYYQVGQVHFAPECGLYMLCQERAPGAGDDLAGLLQRLGDSGLGGRRSYGLGQFTLEGPSTFALDEPAGADQLVLLSRYRPTPAELDAGVLAPEASYDLTRVGGWLQSPAGTPAQRRRSVRMLSEGSVIRILPDGPAIGTICDVRPEYQQGQFPHPVWRYGLALGVGRRSAP